MRRIEPVKETYDGLEINCKIKLVILRLRLNLGYVKYDFEIGVVLVAGN
jgi:hypothetical protein